MENYDQLTSNDELHITTGSHTTILEIAKIIQGIFKANGKIVAVEKAQTKDEVRKDARNEANPFIRKWWKAKTSIEDGIEKIFEEMKKNY